MSDDIFVASVVGVHGLKGGLKVKVEDDNPNRFTKGRILYIGQNKIAITVKSYQSKGLHGILLTDETDSIDKAEPFVGKEITVPESELPPLNDGSYYVKDLIDLAIVDGEGKLLGQLKEVLSYAANDVYVVANSQGKEFLVPVIDEVIKDINLEERKIIIEPMEGLFDED